MRLTLCLEGNTEGRVLASIDMEEIMKHCKANINLSDTIRDIHDNVAKEMYCKGIDDLCEAISVYGMYDEYGNVIDVLDIAQKLKAGGTE